ncbi:MAG: glutathione S-transferase family protein [Acidobacteriota bacterium]|nr:glutathione S-transferase family protein [Acidobacteriota bacterium]
MYKLLIGNKNYSPWSLRPWLHLVEAGIPFEEIRVPLFAGNWREEISRYSPAGRVPVLLDGDLAVWDSMAIHEYLAERHPDGMGWPEDRKARARARSVSAEMHSGFSGVRNELPQNIRARNPRKPEDLSADCNAHVARILEIWTNCRRTYATDGPFLFGKLSIADMLYAPVVMRFVTYDIQLPPEAAAYSEAVRNLTGMQRWIRESEAEPEKLDFIDDLLPVDQTPLSK